MSLFAKQGEIRDIQTSEFNKMIDVNLKASFLLVNFVVDGMKENVWGRIIFISSIAAYGAGINGFCKFSSIVRSFIFGSSS